MTEEPETSNANIDHDSLDLWTASRRVRNSSQHEGEEDEEDERITRYWRESPFAVGKTKPTWADDDVGCYKLCSACCSGSRFTPIYVSAFICGKCPVGRIGNMVVIWQRAEEQGFLLMLGPYWYITYFVTFPFILLYSLYVFLSQSLWEKDWPWMLLWGFFNVIAAVSLFRISCSDPGILRRHAQPPEGEEPPWIWNDQALTYRPTHARFDPECAVVIERFDHVCFWTGTAIGKNNMFWFRLFVPCVFGSAIINSIALVWL